MTYANAIRVLSKRMNWLETRIKNSQKELTYDKEELAALDLAIDLMQDFTFVDTAELPV